MSISDREFAFFQFGGAYWIFLIGSILAVALKNIYIMEASAAIGIILLYSAIIQLAFKEKEKNK